MESVELTYQRGSARLVLTRVGNRIVASVESVSTNEELAGKIFDRDYTVEEMFSWIHDHQDY
jgi:hypothetical protein